MTRRCRTYRSAQRSLPLRLHLFVHGCRLGLHRAISCSNHLALRLRLLIPSYGQGLIMIARREVLMLLEGAAFIFPVCWAAA